MSSNNNLILALNKKPVSQLPIWLMRQAGRYLPEYRQLRFKAKTFLNLCKNPELACQVTLQPLARFPLDAAIIFSDILVIPDAMDLGLDFVAGEGPVFSKPVRTLEDIKKIPSINPEQDLSYVLEAIKLVKKDIKVPLIGFCGSPWTVATYAVEGGSSKSFSIIKKMVYAEPQMAHMLLEKLTQASIDYLKAQVVAGADALMVFDTWGGALAHDKYKQFSLKYMQDIVTALRQDSSTKDTPVILFTKNASGWLEDIANTGCSGVSVDWTIAMSAAKARIGSKVALQGNLDPAILHAPDEVIKTEAAKIIDAFAGEPGLVFNLGHGITPDVNPDKVAMLVDFVHQYSAK